MILEFKKYGLPGLILISLIPIYFIFDPSSFGFFPKCPFYVMTGFDCPGCGSQRAVHHLLHGEFISAFSMNPILILAIPYLALVSLTSLFSNNDWCVKLQSALTGRIAGFVWVAVVMVWWLGRNVF